MSRRHEWGKLKVEAPITVKRTYTPNGRTPRYAAIPVARCAKCPTRRIVLEGPLGGPSLRYEVKGELWWWSPPCEAGK